MKELIEEAREKTIEYLKYIGEFDSKRQSLFLERTNSVIKAIDNLLQIHPKQSPSQAIQDVRTTCDRRRAEGSGAFADPSDTSSQLGQLTESEQLKQIWDGMDHNPFPDYKLMVHRLEPQMLKGMKISGYLKTFSLSTTIPNIIEKIGEDYGGGMFQIRIVDDKGKYVKSKNFEISGLPKDPSSN